MRKVLIFGNSGSGKSTLAVKISNDEGLAHLDLDSLAWLPTTPPERAPILESELKINNFINLNHDWVIEGCYTDLLELVAPMASEIIFMNLSVDKCIINAKKRPWEPHKYKSKEDQDKNLDMLLTWIKQYTERNDVCSFTSHTKFYEQFCGTKTMHTNNESN